MRILIVDDNRQITEVLKAFAEKEGMKVTLAYDGLEALNFFQTMEFDIVLLDIMMPKIDGLELLKKIRAQSLVPVILITARGEDYERIMGLDYGADDYIVKPFSVAEVMARVRAVLRRIKPDSSKSEILHFRDLVLDSQEFRCEVQGQTIPLTKREFELLWTLAEYPNKVFSRDHLLDLLWGDDYLGDIRTVDTHIKRIRAKLPDLENPSWQISTVRGLGYKFEVFHEN